MKYKWKFCLIIVLTCLPFVPGTASDKKIIEQTLKELRTDAYEKQRLDKIKSGNKICNTKILVTTSKTVSFYVGKVVSKNYLGTTGVGQWLNNNQQCIDNKPIFAVSWNEKGTPYQYVSQVGREQRNYNNINKLILVQYPRDFAKALKEPKQAVMCKVQLLNNSKQKVEVFAGQVTATMRLGRMNAWSKQLTHASCFRNQPIFVRMLVKEDKDLKIVYYRSKEVLSDINHIPTIIFPNQFVEVKTLTIPLSPDLSTIIGYLSMLNVLL